MGFYTGPEYKLQPIEYRIFMTEPRLMTIESIYARARIIALITFESIFIKMFSYMVFQINFCMAFMFAIITFEGFFSMSLLRRVQMSH